MQRNWIGKSNGAEVRFDIAGSDKKIDVFTTRPDTIFGADFMVLAPEHELVNEITTAEQQEAIEAYKQYVQSRSERERMTGGKTGDRLLYRCVCRASVHGAQYTCVDFGVCISWLWYRRYYGRTCGR